jgi:hypothetical protein
MSMEPGPDLEVTNERPTIYNARLANTSQLLRRKSRDVGRVSATDYCGIVFVDNDTRTDRRVEVGRVEFSADAEGRYMAWRSVNALERIAVTLDSFLIFVLGVCLFSAVAYIGFWAFEVLTEEKTV